MQSSLASSRRGYGEGTAFTKIGALNDNTTTVSSGISSYICNAGHNATRGGVPLIAKNKMYNQTQTCNPTTPRFDHRDNE